MNYNSLMKAPERGRHWFYDSQTQNGKIVKADYFLYRLPDLDSEPNHPLTVKLQRRIMDVVVVCKQGTVLKVGIWRRGANCPECPRHSIDAVVALNLHLPLREPFA